MSAQDLLSRLDKPKRTGHGTWVARCPAHDDKSPSLTVREMDDGRVLLHCFAGCEPDAVIGAVGLEFDALFPPKPIEHGPRVRRPFPAADVLEALSQESMIVLLCARAVERGEKFDADRLSKAVQRIQHGRELANG